MKLEDWIKDNTIPQSCSDPKGLNVIGTCNECKHWSDVDYCPTEKLFDAAVPSIDKQTFGCTSYWEKKE